MFGASRRKIAGWRSRFNGPIRLFSPCVLSPPADMGVAIWGRDFDPGLHEMVLRGARAVNFCPTVDVFLPVCNEPMDVLDNTWKYVSGLDYDKRKLKVHVLDDGAKEEVRTLAKIYGFECEFWPRTKKKKKETGFRREGC